MRCLLVLAHPVPGSLSHALADRATATLQAGGHEVTRLDLYAEGFDPVLSPAERRGYYARDGHPPALPDHAAQLAGAQGLVLCFPTWWFGMPAILKGWFDRVWSPGLAFDHAPDGGTMRPRLHGLSRVAAITTLGGPWWADRLVMRQPVRKALRYGTVLGCAPGARFQMLSLYRAEVVQPARFEGFALRVEQALSRW